MKLLFAAFWFALTLQSAAASTCTIPNAECSSKINVYDVMHYGPLNTINMSKANSYIALRSGVPAAMNVTKINVYIVLVPRASHGLPFHAFP